MGDRRRPGRPGRRSPGGRAGPRAGPARRRRAADAVRRDVIELLVGADDRTGALEAAGACADAGAGAVWVGTSAAGAIGPVAVVDLATRHMGPADAARRAAGLDAVARGATAHKIDSILRGNWAP